MRPAHLRNGLLEEAPSTPATSREGESPRGVAPEALAELYVSFSTHTAPIMEPRRAPICQWANNAGARREMRAIQLEEANQHLRFVPTMTEMAKSQQGWKGQTGFIDLQLVTSS
jgi:hypothetical protein